MATAMRNDTEWFLVVTATRARILRSLPKPGEIAAAELVMRAPSEGLRALMAGGREHHVRRPATGGQGEDPLKHDERVFMGQVVALLESHRTAGDFTRLHIFAPQHLLDLLRLEASAMLRARIGREFTGNLVTVPERTLPEKIRQVMSGPF